MLFTTDYWRLLPKGSNSCERRGGLSEHEAGNGGCCAGQLQFHKARMMHDKTLINTWSSTCLNMLLKYFSPPGNEAHDDTHGARRAWHLMWPLRSPSLGYQDSIVKTDTSVLSIASEGEKKKWENEWGVGCWWFTATEARYLDISATYTFLKV